MEDIRFFNEETLDDALNVVRDRFDESACRQVRKLLGNPMRRICPDVGDVAYEEGRPVAFQAAVPRRGYVRDVSFLGIAGGLLAAKRGTSPVTVFNLMEKTNAPRHGSTVVFGNTAIPVSMKLNRMLGVDGVGCPSCGIVRFAVLRFGRFLNFCVHGRLPPFFVQLIDWLGGIVRPFFFRRARSPTVGSRLETFNAKQFDAFWSEYLKKNDGVVLSRTAEELDWMFGEDLSSGRNLLFTRENGDRLCGYIVVRAMNAERTRWMVADWIALANDKAVLSDLLRDAVRGLRRIRSAAFLECIGFRMDVQEVIHRHLPFKRKAPNNSTNYKAHTPEMKRALEDADKAGWFFGPYDGDRCMTGS